jgi:hypothetical protein
MRRGRGFGAVAALISAWAWAGLPAGATTSPTPGLLRAADIPVSVQQVGDPTTYATFNLPETAADACTETPVPVGGLTGAFGATFSADGTAVPAAISEFVLSFATAPNAKLEFAERTKNEAARLKCRTVGFVPPGTNAPIASVTYHKATVAKVGNGAFADFSTPTPAPGATGTTSLATATSAGASLTILSGSHLVILSFPGASLPLSVKQMQATATRAVQRLSNR